MLNNVMHKSVIPTGPCRLVVIMPLLCVMLKRSCLRSVDNRLQDISTSTY